MSPHREKCTEAIALHLNETLKADLREMAAKPNRPDRVSGVRIRPVGLPVIGQGELFNA